MNTYKKIERLEMPARVEKLLNKNKFFLVVSEDEPYFEDVYKMIRKTESEKGSWSASDENAFVSKVKSEYKTKLTPEMLHGMWKTKGVHEYLPVQKIGKDAGGYTIKINDEVLTVYDFMHKYEPIPSEKALEIIKILEGE